MRFHDIEDFIEIDCLDKIMWFSDGDNNTIYANQKQVAAMLPYLQKFAETGELK